MTEKEDKLTKAGFDILTSTRVTNTVDIVSSPFTHIVGASPTLGLSHAHGKSRLTFLLWSDMTYLSWSCSALIHSFFSFLFFFLPDSSSYLKEDEMNSKKREGHNILLSTYVIEHMQEYSKYITFLILLKPMEGNTVHILWWNVKTKKFNYLPKMIWLVSGDSC